MVRCSRFFVGFRASTQPTGLSWEHLVITTDGREFSLFDKKLDEIRHCDFDKLNEHFAFFLPLAGIERYTGGEERQVDVKAASRVARLHDEILRVNPDWAGEDKNHALNQFLTRLLFCLFAEDTGSFEKDLFIQTITEYGGEDGQHLQALLQQMFRIMNQPEAQRGKIPAHLRAFPYVNGGLFAEQTDIPVCSARIRRLLLDAAAQGHAEESALLHKLLNRSHFYRHKPSSSLKDLSTCDAMPITP